MLLLDSWKLIWQGDGHVTIENPAFILFTDEVGMIVNLIVRVTEQAKPLGFTSHVLWSCKTFMRRIRNLKELNCKFYLHSSLYILFFTVYIFRPENIGIR